MCEVRVRNVPNARRREIVHQHCFSSKRCSDILYYSYLYVFIGGEFALLVNVIDTIGCRTLV